MDDLSKECDRKCPNDGTPLEPGRWEVSRDGRTRRLHWNCPKCGYTELGPPEE